jgi:hypothetical protein
VPWVGTAFLATLELSDGAILAHGARLQDPAVQAHTQTPGGRVWAATTAPGKHSAKALARRLPARARYRLSAGVGAKGHRWYDWALIDITDPEVPGDHALLVRRSISNGELAFYRRYTPTAVPLATLVAVAGRRWTIEESQPKQVRD